MTLKGKFSKLELMQGRVDFIPNGWEFTHLNKAFNIKNSFRKPINEGDRSENPGIHPYYGPTKIQGYIGSYEQDGDYILIGEDGDHFLKYRTQAMTQMVSGKCTVNNHAHIIEATEKATKEWFYYYFMHRDIFSFLSRQGAGRYKLNKAALEKLPVLLPPLPEQKKIAQILSTWDKAIETVEKLIANSQQKKKAQMQQLLTGKKRFPEFDGEWKKTELGKLLDYKQPTPFLVKSTNYSDEYETPVLTAGKTFVLGYTNESFGIYEDNLPVIIFDDFTTASKFVDFPFKAKSSAMKLLTAKQGISIKYIFEAMQVINYSVGGHQRHWISIFSNLVVNLPPLEEQQKIASVLSSADQEIETCQKELEHLNQTKKALMQQLLTGKRRVKVD